MLVLTRKPQEQIRVGEDVVITILRVKGQSVRIGIQAPPEVSLLRAELTPHQSSAEESPPESPTENRRAARKLTNSRSTRLKSTNAPGKFTTPFAGGEPNRLTSASAFAEFVPGLLRQNTTEFCAHPSPRPRNLPVAGTR